MPVITIERARLDANGQLRLKPAGQPAFEYSYIWRSASSVRWDGAAAEFYVLPIDGFTPTHEWRQILSAVKSEFGLLLEIADATVFENVPPTLEATLSIS